MAGPDCAHLEAAPPPVKPRTGHGRALALLGKLHPAAFRVQGFNLHGAGRVRLISLRHETVEKATRRPWWQSWGQVQLGRLLTGQPAHTVRQGVRERPSACQVGPPRPRYRPRGFPSTSRHSRGSPFPRSSILGHPRGFGGPVRRFSVFRQQALALCPLDGPGPVAALLPLDEGQHAPAFA